MLSFAVAACAAANDEPQFSAGPVTAVLFSADGTTVLDAGEHSFRVRSWPDFDIRAEYDVPGDRIHALVFSDDHRRLLAVGGTSGENVRVDCYDWPSMTLRFEHSFGEDIAYDGVFLTNCGRAKLAVACHDGSIALLDGEGQVIAEVNGHSAPVTSLAVMNGRHGLISGSSDNTIRHWVFQPANDDATDDPSGGFVLRRSLTNHTGPVTGLALKPQADPAALPMLTSAGRDRTVRFWQPTIGRLIRFVRLTTGVTAVAWTKDGSAVVAASEDGSVSRIDHTTLEVTSLLPPTGDRIHCVAVNPIESTAVVGTATGHLQQVALPSQ